MKNHMRELVFVALLAGIPTASWWWIFRPQNAQAADMRKQIEFKQQRLRDLNRATGTIGDLKLRIQKLQEAMSYFRSRLPNEKEIDKVLQEAWQLAEANRLQTRSIRTLERNEANSSITGQPCAEQPISVSLEGSFLGFYSFLQSLENQPRIMRIKSMHLKRPQEGPEGDVQADFTMSIFFESQE